MLLAVLTATITAAPNPAVGYLIDDVGKKLLVKKPHTTSSSVTPIITPPPVSTHGIQGAPAAPTPLTDITNVRYY